MNMHVYTALHLTTLCVIRCNMTGILSLRALMSDAVREQFEVFDKALASGDVDREPQNPVGGEGDDDGEWRDEGQ